MTTDLMELVVDRAQFELIMLLSCADGTSYQSVKITKRPRIILPGFTIGFVLFRFVFILPLAVT